VVAAAKVHGLVVCVVHSPVQLVMWLTPAGVDVAVIEMLAPTAAEQGLAQGAPLSVIETLPRPAVAAAVIETGGIGANVAVSVSTAGAVDASTTHEPAPPQVPPDQPLKVLPGFGVAVNVTVSPAEPGSTVVHVAAGPQLLGRPVGALIVTVPLPDTFAVTVGSPAGAASGPTAAVCAASVSGVPPPVDTEAIRGSALGCSTD